MSPAASTVAPLASGRRADWRFLLPSAEGFFQHLVIQGGSEQLARQIAETGMAGDVSAGLPTRPTADAVVVLAEAQPDYGAIAERLVTGGVLYLEVDRRSAPTAALAPQRVERALRRAGLTPTGLYWAAPDFRRCKRYIPLDRPEAFQWYLSTLYRAGTPLFRFLEIGLRLYMSNRNRRFAPLAPCFAVTAVKGSPRASLPSVLGHPAVPGAVGVPGSRPVVLTSGHDAASRAVILPFAPGSCQPSAVLKVSTLPKFNENTELEQVTLTEIRTYLDAPMRRTIPQPLGLFQYGPLSVGVESGAAGMPLNVSSGRWNASVQRQEADLQHASRWLTQFHLQANLRRIVWDTTALQRWVTATLAAYSEIFGLTAPEQYLFARMRRHAQGLLGTEFPLVWVHGDFGPWNLYRAADELTVIDWEYNHTCERGRFGLALYDLLYFVTYWTYLVRRLNTEAAELQGFHGLFIETSAASWHIAAVRQAITQYMAALDILPRFLPLVLVFLWVEQALHHFSRRQSLGETQADPRTGNRSVKYIALLAEHANTLFAEQGPSA
jgi:hypothetical protein